MNIIQQLKDNERPFGLMDTPMQAKALSMDISNFQYYTSERKWEDYPAGDFYYDQACRLRPDYEEEPEIVECEIKPFDGYGEDLRYKKPDAPAPYSIFMVLSDPDFIGFKFEDGDVRPVPVVYTPRNAAVKCCWDVKAEDLGAYAVLHATSVLFRRQK